MHQDDPILQRFLKTQHQSEHEFTVLQIGTQFDCLSHWKYFQNVVFVSNNASEQCWKTEINCYAISLIWKKHSKLQMLTSVKTSDLYLFSSTPTYTRLSSQIQPIKDHIHILTSTDIQLPYGRVSKLFKCHSRKKEGKEGDSKCFKSVICHWTSDLWRFTLWKSWCVAQPRTAVDHQHRSKQEP